MKAVSLHDKGELEAYLRQHHWVNYYLLGDLDDFLWPHTQWYALKEGDNIQAVALLYTDAEPPVLLAIENDNFEPLQALLEAIKPRLSGRFYSHLSPGLEQVFASGYKLEPHGEHYKMALKTAEGVKEVNTAAVDRLTPEDLPQLTALYKASYPGNWFNPRMLETGQYFGIRGEGGELISVAGVHVYSPQYKVAALGNITTHPDRRGGGLGTTVTARLCQSLLESVEVIGLNVKCDNTAAVHVYRKLGFEVVARYNEIMVKAE